MQIIVVAVGQGLCLRNMSLFMHRAWITGAVDLFGGSSTWAGVALAAAAVVAGIARGVLCGLGMGHGVWNLYAMHYACIAGATPLTGSNYADRRRYSPEVCCVAWDTAFAVSMLQCIILCVHSGRDVSYCSRKLQTVARRCVWS